jgi:hypothetical protein
MDSQIPIIGIQSLSTDHRDWFRYLEFTSEGSIRELAGHAGTILTSTLMVLHIKKPAQSITHSPEEEIACFVKGRDARSFLEETFF